LFHEAEQGGNSDPMRRFADLLMAADEYSVQRLVPYFGAADNCYSRFFERFSRSQFLTFNYDSLAELFLLRENTWYPRDGYGIPIDLDLHPTVENVEMTRSMSLVLHLHGTLCIYASNFALDKPLHE